MSDDELSLPGTPPTLPQRDDDGGVVAITRPSHWDGPISWTDDEVSEVEPFPLRRSRPLRDRSLSPLMFTASPLPPPPSPLPLPLAPPVVEEKKAKPKGGKKSAWWVATVFNEEEQFWAAVLDGGRIINRELTGVGDIPDGWDPEAPLYQRFAKLRHLSFQLELCPDTGRTHAHLLVGYKEAQRISAVQTLFDCKCHVERPKDLRATYVYGTALNKDGQRKRAPDGHLGLTGSFTFGVPAGGQGSRTDIEALLLAVKVGASEKEALEGHTTTVARHMTFYKHIRSVYEEPPTRLVRVFWLYGPPRVGKNTALSHRYSSLYIKSAGSARWFDGYTGQKVLCLNDMDSDDTVKVGDFMSWTDGLPLRVQVKGSTVCARWDVVWFTANVSLDTFLTSRNFASAQDEAFRARIEGVFYLAERNAKFEQVSRNPAVGRFDPVDQMSHLDLP